MAGIELLGPVGFEQGGGIGSNDKPLQNRAKSGAAESGALSGNSPQIDAELAKVIEAWPTLPDAIKAAVLALVNSAQATDGR